MKKFLLILTLLAPLAAIASEPAKNVSRSEIASIINEFRHCDGVEVVRLGRLATGALKGVIRTAGVTDPDTRKALEMIRGLRGLTVLEYEDAPSDIRYRLDRRIERALQKSELLMEAKEDDSLMRMFGTVDDTSGMVRDFVIHVPDSGTLVCLFGSMSLEVLREAMADD
ncbi:MAG: DUF4252 domain-containing protein [Bacteroidales bacterium]|jgi:hypothetical protein|nr:DUF4252 domain-containing protein [Bacteroidales bacterium]